jgi:Ras-related GTP-binding protein C/D
MSLTRRHRPPSRSGKSSISSVVFHKLPPNETLFLESTARIQQDSMA